MADLCELLARGDVLGLGESFWQRALKAPERVVPLYRETLARGKLVEGHSAGARDRKLGAYVAAGVSSCHEPITAEEVLARLRLGLHVMIREGSVRRDLAATAAVKDAGVDLRRLVLVTDGLWPQDMENKGGMDFIVQKAVDCGFDPVAAVQMATLNPAEHFRIDHIAGGIAPGKSADFSLIPDLRNIRPETVVSQGRVVLEEKTAVAGIRRHEFPAPCRETIRLAGPFQPSDFRIPAAGEQVQVRVVEMITDLVTKERNMKLPVVDGEIRPDPDRDVAKIAAVARSGSPGGRISRGWYWGSASPAGLLPPAPAGTCSTSLWWERTKPTWPWPSTASPNSGAALWCAATEL